MMFLNGSFDSDILNEIIAAQPMEIQFNNWSSSGSKKREREDQGENRHATTTYSNPSIPIHDGKDLEMPYSAPESGRTLSSFSSPLQPSAQTGLFDPLASSTTRDQVMFDHNSLFGLPLHTEDLGRLPVPLSNDHVLNWFENNPSPDADPYWSTGDSNSGTASAKFSGLSGTLASA